MNNEISSLDNLDRKLTEILRPVYPQDEYIENLHQKLKERVIVQIGGPNYYSLLVFLLILTGGVFLLISMKKVYRFILNH